MASVLDPRSGVVRAAAEDARDIFERLGARALLRRLEDALARDPLPADRSAPSRPMVDAGSAG
jgi:hypothetical protein